MDMILAACAAWWWLIVIVAAIGIGTFGNFVHMRLKAKDQLKLEQMKTNNTQANTTLAIEASKERQEALRLRALQIEHNLPTHYIPVLDDPEPKNSKLK